MMWNEVRMAGHLGKDPEIRYTNSGKAVVSVDIALLDKWKNKEGEQKEETTWVTIELWGRAAETFADKLSKGTNVFIAGRLKEEKWVDKNNNKREKLKVVCDRWQFGSNYNRQNSDSGRSHGQRKEETHGEEKNKSKSESKGSDDNWI